LLQSYRDFHADLFPDTTGPVSTLGAQQWFAGENRSVAKISLDPAKKQATTQVSYSLSMANFLLLVVVDSHLDIKIFNKIIIFILFKHNFNIGIKHL
jgi:hypothetical protein